MGQKTRLMDSMAKQGTSDSNYFTKKSIHSAQFEPDNEFFTYAEIMNKDNDKVPPKEFTDSIYKDFDDISFSAISF